jgi:hypothetical protein
MRDWLPLRKVAIPLLLTVAAPSNQPPQKQKALMGAREKQEGGFLPVLGPRAFIKALSTLPFLSGIHHFPRFLVRVKHEIKVSS